VARPCILIGGSPYCGHFKYNLWVVLLGAVQFKRGSLLANTVSNQLVGDAEGGSFYSSPPRKHFSSACTVFVYSQKSHSGDSRDVAAVEAGWTPWSGGWL